MPNKTIVVRKEDAVCFIKMNRPELMNALDLDMIDAFQAALDQIGQDRTIKVVILEGSGGNFCTGASMSRFAEGLSAPFWQDAMKRLHRVIYSLREIPQPVISKVRGMAIGGGINIALSADFVIASHTAKFRKSS